MDVVQRLSWISFGFCAFAMLIQPYQLLEPLFLGCIGVAMGLCFAGLCFVQKEWQDVEEAIMLERRWTEQKERVR